MSDSTEKDEWAIVSMLKELNKMMIKELKGDMMTKMHQINNTNKQKSFKKNQKEILSLKNIWNEKFTKRAQRQI